MKKRQSARQPQLKKRQPSIQNVNKTFQISKNTDRSPLQCCENLEESRWSTSPKGDSLVILENKVCLSPISPILQENQNVTFTPLSMRRSTTYSVLEADDCDALSKDVKETFTVMPMCDYVLETKLENAHIQPAETQNRNTDSFGSPEQLRRLTASDPKRTVSPDSLPVLESSVPILSPDQFLRENQINTEVASQVCKPVLPSSLGPCVLRSFPQKQKKAMLQTVTFSAEPQFQSRAFNATSEGELELSDYEKCEENLRFPTHTIKHQICQFQKQEPPRRPLLSSTVTKSKQGPLEGKDAQMLKSKSKKCLSNAIQQCVDKVPEGKKTEGLPNLPVIEFLPGAVDGHRAEKASTCSESPSHNRKRKSRECLEEINSGSEEYMDNFETKKLSVSCELNVKQMDLKKSFPTSANREKPSQKKRVGNLTFFLFY